MIKPMRYAGLLLAFSLCSFTPALAQNADRGFYSDLASSIDTLNGQLVALTGPGFWAFDQGNGFIWETRDDTLILVRVDYDNGFKSGSVKFDPPVLLHAPGLPTCELSGVTYRALGYLKDVDLKCPITSPDIVRRRALLNNVLQLNKIESLLNGEPFTATKNARQCKTDAGTSCTQAPMIKELSLRPIPGTEKKGLSVTLKKGRRLRFGGKTGVDQNYVVVGSESERKSMLVIDELRYFPIEGRGYGTIEQLVLHLRDGSLGAPGATLKLRAGAVLELSQVNVTFDQNGADFDGSGGEVRGELAAGSRLNLPNNSFLTSQDGSRIKILGFRIQATRNGTRTVSFGPGSSILFVAQSGQLTFVGGTVLNVDQQSSAELAFSAEWSQSGLKCEGALQEANLRLSGGNLLLADGLDAGIKSGLLASESLTFGAGGLSGQLRDFSIETQSGAIVGDISSSWLKLGASATISMSPDAPLTFRAGQSRPFGRLTLSPTRLMDGSVRMLGNGTLKVTGGFLSASLNLTEAALTAALDVDLLTLSSALFTVGSLELPVRSGRADHLDADLIYQAGALLPSSIALRNLTVDFEPLQPVTLGPGFAFRTSASAGDLSLSTVDVDSSGGMAGAGTLRLGFEQVSLGGVTLGAGHFGSSVMLSPDRVALEISSLASSDLSVSADDKTVRLTSVSTSGWFTSEAAGTQLSLEKLTSASGHLDLGAIAVDARAPQLEGLKIRSGAGSGWSFTTGTFPLEPSKAVRLFSEWTGASSNDGSLVRLRDFAGGPSSVSGNLDFDLTHKAFSVGTPDFSLHEVHLSGTLHLTPEQTAGDGIAVTGVASIYPAGSEVRLSISLGPALLAWPKGAQPTLKGPMSVKLSPFEVGQATSCSQNGDLPIFGISMHLKSEAEQTLAADFELVGKDFMVNNGAATPVALTVMVDPPANADINEHVEACCRVNADDDCCPDDSIDPSCRPTSLQRGSVKGYQEITRKEVSVPILPDCTLHVWLRPQVRHATAVAHLISKGARPGLSIEHVQVTDWPNTDDWTDGGIGVYKENGCDGYQVFINVFLAPIGIFRSISEGDIKLDTVGDLVSVVARAVVTSNLEKISKEF